MASENETVAEIVTELRSECADDEIDVAYTQPELMARLDRIEAAYKRELDCRAIIAGASLADSVEEKYKREIAELKKEMR